MLLYLDLLMLVKNNAVPLTYLFGEEKVICLCGIFLICPDLLENKGLLTNQRGGLCVVLLKILVLLFMIKCFKYMEN